jgi:hypothetical protein
VIFGRVGFGAVAGGSPIRAIQTDLKKIGALARINGVLDANTVNGVNQVLGGWDDAPPKLRTGKLSSHDIAANLPAVRKYLHAAVTGALVFHDVNA